MGTTDRRDVRTSDPSEFEIRRAELVGQIGNVRPVIPKDADLFYINASDHVLDVLAHGADLFLSH